MIRHFLIDERGATALEYAVIAGLIAMVIIVAIGMIGDEVNTTFTNVEAGFPDT